MIANLCNTKDTYFAIRSNLLCCKHIHVYVIARISNNQI